MIGRCEWIKLNWLIAAVLFFSGANLIGLLVPVGFALVPLSLIMFATRPARLSNGQFAIILTVMLAAIAGIIRADDVSEITDNVRQLVVVLVAALLVGMLGDEADDVVRRYFAVFSAAAIVGISFYLVLPNFAPFSTAIGSRSFQIGPSSSLFDGGYRPKAFLGPYRFQGLFDEPGTFAVLGAGAAFCAILARKRLKASIITAGIIFSEGLAGVGSLIVLLLAKWLGQISFARKAQLAGAIILVVLIFLASETGQAAIDAVQDYYELRKLSGQVRGNQLDVALNQWQKLFIPAGFSNAALIRVMPNSVTIGYLRTLIVFGIPLTALLMVALLVAFYRTPFRSATGVMLSTLILAGLSRSGVFDLLLGWFVLFSAVRTRSAVLSDKPIAAVPAAPAPALM
jgi:hypothetical protein